ncbi:outer membrane protein assembly factor BamA [Salinispirillum sp. LH 10-3-1]|uniref:Outer membrane protein assembly factor BamA n=1 Tax=Salinispirillum sp. LH 10-3-1 TaxID=2952525 RepID=A0AB38YIU9_9GAMM
MAHFKLLGGLCLLGVTLSAAVPATPIEVDGLRRVSTAAFLSSLPGVNDGRAADDFNSAEAVRALYATGLYQDVAVYRTATGAYYFEVLEYSIIDRVSFSGNKRIPTEALDSALENVGVIEGQSYQPAIVAQIQSELESQYAIQGRYDARVEVSIEPLPQNRVAIIINIEEGAAAAIRSVEIRGNEVFETSELLRETRLRPRRSGDLLQLFSRRHQYNRDEYSGDLERLSSYYYDRGYVRFNIENSQISLEPDLSGVHLLTEIFEGERYRWGDISVTGDFADREEDIRAAVRPVSGEWFSRAEMVSTQNRIIEILGNDGYLYAGVEPQASVDDDDLRVDMVFVVRPGPLMYVRSIQFVGNQGTLDEVLRREMRIEEGGLARNGAITQSRRRLQQLGFFSVVNVRQQRVPGTDDQVDIIFSVLEDKSGNLQASVGFQPGVGVFGALEFSQTNFLGTGKSLSLRSQFSESTTILSLNHVDPYFTKSGISRDLNLFYERRNNRNVETYGLDRWGGEFALGTPVSENSRIKLGVGYTQTELYVGNKPPLEVTDFQSEYGNTYGDWTLELQWNYSNQIGSFYSTEGQRHNVSATVTVPGSDLNYYRVTYRGDYVQPVSPWDGFAIRVLGQAGYGDGFGDTDRLPFYKHFFAGGPGTVRGYRDRTVSPFSTTEVGNENSAVPFGGNILLSSGLELITPTPFFRDQSLYRTALFVDVGGAFTERCLPGNDQCQEGISLDGVRASYGVDFVWRPVPMLPLRFIYARPLLEQEDDLLQRFQLSFWSNF